MGTRWGNAERAKCPTVSEWCVRPVRVILNGTINLMPPHFVGDLPKSICDPHGETRRVLYFQSDGRLLVVNLTSADLSDRSSAEAIRKSWRWVKHLFADSACDRPKLMGSAASLDLVAEIIRGPDDQKGFKVLSRRWAAECNFGWMIRWCRLEHEYEQRIDVSHAMILLTIGSYRLRRYTHLCFSKRTLTMPRVT